MATPAVLGLKKWVHEKRTGRAEKTVDKMERKAELYDHLGDAAMRSTVETENPPRPLNWAERYMDNRSERKAFKGAVKAAERKYTLKAYGSATSDTLTSKTRISSLVRQHGVNADYRAGNMTAMQRRQAKSHIKETPRAYENPMQRQSRRRLKGAENRLQHAAQQPILSRWRDARQEGAKDRVESSQQRLVDLEQEIEIKIQQRHDKKVNKKAEKKQRKQARAQRRELNGRGVV